jgi:hypothetical protein
VKALVVFLVALDPLEVVDVKPLHLDSAARFDAPVMSVVALVLEYHQNEGPTEALFPFLLDPAQKMRLLHFLVGTGFAPAIL